MGLELQVRLYNMASSLYLEVELENTFGEIVQSLRDDSFIQQSIDSQRLLFVDGKGEVHSLDNYISQMGNIAAAYVIVIDLRSQSQMKIKKQEQASKYSPHKKQKIESAIQEKQDPASIITDENVANCVNAILYTNFDLVAVMKQQGVISKTVFNSFQELHSLVLKNNETSEKQMAQIRIMRSFMEKVIKESPKVAREYLKDEWDCLSDKTQESLQEHAEDFENKLQKSMYESSVIQSEMEEEADSLKLELNTLEQKNSTLTIKIDKLTASNEKFAASNDKLELKLQMLRQQLSKQRANILEKASKKEEAQSDSKGELLAVRKAHKDDMLAKDQTIDLLERDLLQKQEREQEYDTQIAQKTEAIMQLEQRVHKLEIETETLKNSKSKNEMKENVKEIIKIVKVEAASSGPFSYSRIIVPKVKAQQQSIINFLASSFPTQKVQTFDLLYSYDPFNKANFHKYVDGHKNLLLIAETVRGNIFGAFSQKALRPNSFGGGQTFLFSLKKDKKYPLKANSKGIRAIQYDPYFLVFGNDDFYIQQNSDQLQVNKDFGSSLSSFEIDKEDAKNFLEEGEGVAKAKLRHYEVYAVNLKVI